ncbi:peptidylprolyl isomerase [uncultured Oscillibacter sp.]|uniref:peptidylprolyl isomerase n=1 Tax=uncultured Oscillibacter sp. TaxID=876091 RepID=UPI00262D49A1|nr:peptidylprolyl isomerase [uncultured Oscillibacter sp.]
MNDDYTPQQRLSEVNKAIQAVLLGGQSYKLGSRSVSRADLALLKAMRDELEAAIVNEVPTPLFGDTYVAFFEGR